MLPSTRGEPLAKPLEATGSMSGRVQDGMWGIMQSVALSLAVVAMQGLVGVSAFQAAGAFPALQAGRGPLPEQRLGECRLCHGDVCSGCQELCTSYCRAPETHLCMLCKCIRGRCSA